MSDQITSEKPLLSAKEHEEAHIDAGEYLKSMVYGGMDGTLNTLLIILSGVSSNT